MSIEKTSLRNAILEAKEIEKFAADNAKKILEETMSPKLEQVVKDTIKELEKEKLNESMTIAITLSDDKDDVVSTEITPEVPEVSDVPNQEAPKDIESFGDEENNQTLNNDEDMENQEEIYEITNEAAESPEQLAAEPVETATQAPVEAPIVDANVANPFADINQKLDTILNKIEGGASAGEPGKAEGEIEITDDETPVPTNGTPITAPEQQTAEQGNYVTEDMQEENMDGGTAMDEIYEFEESLSENDKEESYNMEGIGEIEIVDEEDKEKLDETPMGLGFNKQQQAGSKTDRFKQDGHHAPIMSESQIKAQHEAIIAGLKQENESLKSTIKEYADSFKVLRKQINETQTFNAKLAFANQLFVKGGVTNAEKIKIGEAFDKVTTIEEAKKLYNTLLTETTFSGVSKTPSVSKLQSVRPAIIAPTATSTSSTAKTLYESDEVVRMRKLAGIKLK